ncbi:MAG TPA: hypothetical protein V6D08_14565 [Candidatus Obscuribacterales bacterium]
MMVPGARGFRRDCLAWAGVLALVFSPAAWALLSDAEAVTLIEKARIVTPDSQVQARVGAGEVAVSLYRNPKANDKDCKIDAILMAKALMDADPKGISTVKVRFYDPANRSSYREVNVGLGVVKAFAQRRVSTDELLASVVIERGEQDISRYRQRTYRDISQSPDVIDGVYRAERLNLLSRIQMLRQRGVGVQPFLGEFFRIEDKVRQGDDASVIKGLQFLSQKLADMEERYEQAHAGGQRTGAAGQPGPSGRLSAGPYGQPPPPADNLQAMQQRLRQELGELAPSIGPQLNRRYRIARRIADLQAEGRVVDQYRRLYREIEELAAQGNAEHLRLKLTVAEHQLGLPSFQEE